ncbi:hypothetical protein LV89_00973 [Arcicella aurantiaca]|uniref:Uncharacterized protein n=1 Tax=Arcicella aurantiaca TaxID=591202 RepID=A0A316ECE6_9BACT|nr:hypothetical protein [Arcicella aurantiaca]PWK28194.1 hypothetical protein LV89_00973 [Arcicella aurantiaca]
MGQYLAIGIATNFTASKREVEAVSIEKVIEKMTADIGFDTNLYELEETEYSWQWNLKSDKIQSEFVPFLEHFYRVMGKFVRLDDADEVIQKLKSEQSKSLQAFLKKGHFYNFQESYSNDSYDFFFEKEGSQMKNRVRITSGVISLAMTGKIMMEATGGFFEFFEAMIHQNFSEFDLSKNIRVYIAG